ncbi:MAG: hypothetical protein M3132_11010 [Actinomycetia bacterium]|nr:hypothetical protein [Actinomycetes bacterium]
MSYAATRQLPPAVTAMSSRVSARSAAAIALWLVIGLAGPGLFNVGSLGFQIFLTSSACATTSAFALFLYARSRDIRITELWLTFPGLFWLTSFFTLGLASLAWVSPNTESYGIVSQAEVAEALQYALVWLWATIAGLWWTAPRLRFRSPIGRFDDLSELFNGSSAIAYVVGLASIVYLVSVQRFSYISGAEAALTATSSIPQVAMSMTFGMTIGSIVMLWKGLTVGSKRLAVTGLAMFGIAAMVSLIGGMKEPVIASLFGLAATYRLARGRLPKGSLVVGAAVVLFLFAFVNTYRTGVRIDELSVTESLAASVDILGGDTGSGLLASTTDSIASVTSRTQSIDSLGLIIARTPTQIPFRDVMALPAEVASMFVPRSLWPNKPIIAEGYRFAIEYTGQSRAVHNSFAVTLVGDAYRHGGLLSVLGFGLLLGMYLAVLDRLVNPLKHTAALIMFIALALNLAKSESGIAVTIASQARTALVVGVMMVLVIAQHPPETARYNRRAK